MKTWIVEMRNDLQAENSGCLLKSPLAGPGHIVNGNIRINISGTAWRYPGSFFTSHYGSFPETYDLVLDVMVAVLVFDGTVLLCPRPHRAEALSDDARLTSVCLSRTSGGSREQRGLGRLKLAQK